MTSGKCPSGFAAALGRSVAAVVARAGEAAACANVAFPGDAQLLLFPESCNFCMNTSLIKRRDLACGVTGWGRLVEAG